MSEILYRGWKIYPNDFVGHHLAHTVAWCFVHEDYDGAPNYSDEGPGDSRCGAAASVEACKAEIDLWEEEHADA